jgi:hypothetical protein
MGRLTRLPPLVTMTGPSSGYPDWQQYASWRGLTLYSQQIDFTPGATQSIGEWAMGNYASIRIMMSGITNGAEVFLFGADDEFGTQEILVERWVVRPDTVIRVVVPVITPWVRMEAVGAAGVNSSIVVNVQQCNIATEKAYYAGSDSVVSAYNIVLPAGNTNIYYPPVLLPGPAHFWGFVQNPGVVVIFEIWLYDTLGARTDLIEHYRLIPTTGTHDQLVLPAKPWRMEVTNSTGVNQTFYFTVTSQGTLT